MSAGDITSENIASENKGSILFLSKRRDAASSRYRIFQFWEGLQARGWHCDYRAANQLSPLGRWRLARECRRYSLVVIQRKLFDAPTLRLLQAYNPNLVFDYDDAIFLNDDGSASSRRARRFANTTRRARLVLAGNGYLASHSASAQTHLLPTCISLAHYSQTPPHPETPRPDDDATSLKLVWIGSRSTRKYLEQHRDTLEAIGRAHPEVELTIISDFSLSFENLRVRCLPWSADTEVRELQQAHIGIAPMTDDPWTRGKCGLKVIQYMACGLPVISSNCGANAEIVAAGQTGLLATTTAEWLTAIGQLRDPQRRQQMGQAGQARAHQRYTVESQLPRLDQWFTEMVTP